MDGFSNLMEFSIALAGFTSIVVVFVHKDERWNAFDIFRVKNALFASLGAAFLSAIPGGLAYSGLQPDHMWGIHGILVTSYLAFILVSVVVRSKKTLTKNQRDQMPKSVVYFLYLLALMLMISTILALAGSLKIDIRTMSYFSIIYLLLLSTFAFMRIIFFRPIDHK